jgi:hypothetical protein
MSDNIESYVSPICLPWKSNDPGYSTAEGQILTATSWGTTTNDRDTLIEVCNDLSHNFDRLISVAFNVK